MIIRISEHDHLTFSGDQVRSNKCYEIWAFAVIDLVSEVTVFETWCLRALILGFKPVGGTAFCKTDEGEICRRQSFKLHAPHVGEDVVEELKKFAAEW